MISLKKIVINILQVICMLFWISFLQDADSYYIPYLVIAILSFGCLYINYNERKSSENKIIILVSSAIFSVMVLAANYSILLNINYLDYAGSTFRNIYKLCVLILLFIGGYFTGWNILYCMERKLEGFSWKKKTYEMSSVSIFVISFVFISMVNIVLLFVCKYPGNLSPDSIFQINQIMLESYSNHHPFYHTMVLKLFVTIGLKLFGNMSGAIAMYCVFQILFMAMCFSMVAFTIYEMKASLILIIIVTMWYILMPFHIMYSFTVWKDVMFGGFVLLFSIFIFRILRKIGKYKIFNYIMFFISSLGICLFRSNGFFTFLLIFLVFSLFFWNKERNICILFIEIIVISFFMKHFVLSNLGVQQPDVVEALSIPLQQVSRAVVEGNDFTENQKELLNQVIDIAYIPDTYIPWISDPIKNLIREKGNQEYIINNKLQYIKLYIDIGMKYPFSYIKAWIDETRGFWNAGYSYWYWTDQVYENEYEIERIIYSETLNRCFDEYLWIFSNNRLLQLFLCIGFYVWINLFLCFISIIKKDNIGLFLSVPTLALIISLLISSPVYSEFRYVYAIFCSLPFLIVAVFYENKV